MATEEHGSGLQIHPMDQFVVKPLFGDGPIEWYTPTNVTLWMGIAVLAMIALLVLSTRRRARAVGGRDVLRLHPQDG